ncbi:alpha/beta hydrolase [Cellulomonas xiejunii]|uniref:Alpha/beta hydrolase n=1 Tax=Cellulomonas xiejunii TaxID=2968083 RepID=A0ABY5KKF5_9CELL|nr:alpha/beta hydrolase [Cellulomonas xiejunii]UUI70820.1 alpha/beta hydrolase [Cellulomonas xiejunii]
MTKAQFRRALAVTTVAACLATTVTAFTATGASAHGRPGAGHDRTSRAEAARVDRVPTPDPGWYDCSSIFMPGSECGTVELPLDYDQPRKGTTEVALLRVRATDPAQRIGSLFVNPGGPGGSGVEIAAFAPYFLSPEVLARFDVVGLDPRGTNYSSNVQCFRNVGEQDAALSGMYVPFPQGQGQTAAFVDSAWKLGKACSTTGTPLSASMSTAQVARDMDVVRRAVGDEKLTFLGFSYGSYLGQVYANMFPDRVRAVTIDGVLDPLAWAGTRATANIPVTERLASGTAAWRATQEILDRCEQAGPDLCRTAGIGEPRAVWDGVAAGLRATPIELRDPETDELIVTVDWPVFVSAVLGTLYAPEAYLGVDALTWAIHWLLQPETPENAEIRAEALASLVGYERAQQQNAAEHAATRTERASELGFAFPYYNGTEAFSAVLCTDSVNPRRPEDWIAASERQDAIAPGFGPSWTWGSAQCASKAWTARDEDAWTGRFDARTASPVLVVGNLWDPATAYEGAVAAAKVLPNSRLLTSDNWGHTAYGTSACATEAIDRYLIGGELPVEGTQCTGDVQPFVDQPMSRGSQAPRALPPVVPPVPGSTPRSS